MVLNLKMRDKLNKKIIHRGKTGFKVPVRNWLVDKYKIEKSNERGLRPWAKLVYNKYTNLNGAY